MCKCRYYYNSDTDDHKILTDSTVMNVLNVSDNSILVFPIK